MFLDQKRSWHLGKQVDNLSKLFFFLENTAVSVSLLCEDGNPYCLSPVKCHGAELRSWKQCSE